MQNRSNFPTKPYYQIYDGVREDHMNIYLDDTLSQSSYYGPKLKPLGVHRQVINKQYIVRWNGSYSAKSYLPFEHSAEWAGPCSGVGPDCPFLDSSNAYNRALDQLYEEIRGGVDLSIDAFQLSQTEALAKSLWNVYRAANRFDLHTLYKEFKSWRGGAKNISNLWLQWIYGLKPTIDDVVGAAHQLTVATERAMTVGLKASDREDINIVEMPAAVNGTVFDRKVVTGWKSASVVGRLRYQFTGGSLEMASRLSSLNPFSIGWELLPFSFVFDWAYNVGGYLRNFESALVSASSFKEGWITIGQKSHTVGDMYVNGNNLPYNEGSGHVSGETTISHKDRVPLASSPLPRPPVWKTNFLGPIRAANAIALLGSTFKPK